jgi:hypothetical protein
VAAGGSWLKAAILALDAKRQRTSLRRVSAAWRKYRQQRKAALAAK